MVVGGANPLLASGSATHLIIKDSTNLYSSAGFATHHLYATKHKDTEPRCAAAANNMNPSDPIVSFNKFFDGESLLQEDLYVLNYSCT